MIEVRDGWAYGELADDTGFLWPVRRFPQQNPSNPGMTLKGTPNLTLHTTETDGYVESLRVPSQWQCGEGIIGQHIREGLAGDALHTWDAYSMGIEMVGRSQLVRWLPKETTLGPTVALVAWLHRTDRIRTGLKRPATWDVILDRGPQAVESYYRRLAGLWPQTAGVYGHVDIPDNSHWDPGSFDYPRFFARVQAAIEVQEDEMGMTPEQQDKLERLWNMLTAAQEELGLDGPNGRAIGSRVGQATRKVEQQPAPGLPPHEHSLQGKAT